MSEMLESKVESVCPVCGRTFRHWRSAARVTCSFFCKFQITGNKTHGLSGTPEHRTWKSMRWRCNEKNPDRARYYDRGITVCPRWDNFLNFLDDMGQKPSPKHTIDRIDNDLGYSPTNCRWATMKEQANNTRRTNYITVKGERINLTDIYASTGISQETLRSRIKKGWAYNKIVSTPVKANSRERDSYGQFV